MLIMEIVTGVLMNLPLVSALIAMFVAQSVKILYYWIIDKEFYVGHFFEAGGMPSSHSALVCALTSMIGFTSGWSSVWFAISCVLSIIVMYDAAGVRRAAGKQALILNKIIEDVYTTGTISEHKLQELMGHTPLEVLVGAILGLINSALLYLIVYK